MFETVINRARSGNTAGNRLGVLGVGVIGVGFVGYLDWLTGKEVALSIVYLVPLGICTWLGGRAVGAFLSVLAALVWTYLDILDGRPYSHQWYPVWNGCVRLGIFVLVTFLIDLVRDLTFNLHNLVQVRTAALQSEVRQRKELERIATQISSREQQRLGAELHDQLAGHLTGLAFRAKAISESLEQRGLPEGIEARKLVEFLNQALKQLRAFCRLLAPVDSGTLEPGLSRLGAEIETAFGITCIVQTPKDAPDIGLDRARLVYAIAQEAVRRAVEKRMAKQVEISLAQVGQQLRLTILDDGLPPDSPENPEEQELGIRIMRYRAETLGGSIAIDRSGPGGSLVTCTIPLESHPTEKLAVAA